MDDQQAAVQWAQNLLNRQDLVILDTETTGLHNAEICQIAIIDRLGQSLINSYVKPTIPIPKDATRIHGITDRHIKDAPTFPEIYPIIWEALKGKMVCIYNASYDVNVLGCCCKKHNLISFWHPEKGATNKLCCAMEYYSQWVGEWNDYHGNYRWQKLPAGDHSALGDCLATLKIIQKMASYAN